MNLTEFAVSRGIKHSALCMYINRHPELFDGHLEKTSKGSILDDAAYEILDKKYPVPKPVQIVEDEELRRKYEELKDQIIIAQGKIQVLLEEKVATADLIAEAKLSRELLETQDREISQKDEMISHQEKEISDLRDQISIDQEQILEISSRTAAAEERADQEEKKRIQAEEELNRIRSRGFWARIFNR